jgi:hypothetical protein
MPPAGLKPAIPAKEGPQTLAFDTGKGTSLKDIARYNHLKYIVFITIGSPVPMTIVCN